MSELTTYLQVLADHRNLTMEESTRAFQILLTGGATPAQTAAFLMALRVKGETVDEITGAAQTMRARSGKVNAPENALDTCGTGGDSAGTLNISTAVAFVVAGCGIPVAKHGNRAISSKSGSADVLIELGVNVDASQEAMEEALREANICFMMAPKFHQAMKHVAEVRAELKIRTIFNLLGPLCNPASTRYHLLGVFSEQWVEPMAQVLKTLGAKRAWVVHGSDGMDELTTTGVSQVAELKDGEIRCFEVHPTDVGLNVVEPIALMGSSALYNAKELRALLEGEIGAYRDVVLLNAAASLVVADRAPDLASGIAIAAEAIDNGKALACLKKLAEITSR